VRAGLFAAEGAAVADSPAEVAAVSDVVVVCVSDTPDVEAVVLGAGGVLEGARSGTLVVGSTSR